MGFTSPAIAGHGDSWSGEPTMRHQQAPDKPLPGRAHTTSDVAGKVTTTPTNLGSNKTDVAHGHYQFIETGLACSGTEGGTYDVDVDGGTDGPCQLETRLTYYVYDDGCPPDSALDWEHGRTNAAAWSNSSGYSGGSGGANANKGDINASGSTGWVKFVRAGTQVEAWGKFTSGGLAGQCFDAALVFTPDVDGATVTPSTYDLQGEAIIFDCP